MKKKLTYQELIKKGSHIRTSPNKVEKITYIGKQKPLNEGLYTRKEINKRK